MPNMLLSVSSLLCLTLTAYAVPTPLELEARAVSTDVLGQLNLWEQYAAAAYCPSNNDSPGDKVSCGAGNCPLVEAATTSTLIEFQNSLLTDVTGFVAVDSTSRNIVVSFRGTKSVRNRLIGLDIVFVDTDICPGCKVHKGFWLSWVESRDNILKALKDAVSKYPGYGIVATGHSLGAAIATLCAANLRNGGYAVALYTFGSPQVGTQTTADYISRQPGGNYRVTHTDDLVPKLPGLEFGYRHVGPEYFIKSPNDVVVTAADIQVIPGQPLVAGNQATLTSSVDAHGWYFNAIGACSPPGFEFKE